MNFYRPKWPQTLGDQVVTGKLQGQQPESTIDSEGKLPLGTGWAGQHWLLASRHPKSMKLKVGFFQFDDNFNLFMLNKWLIVIMHG